MCIRDRAKAEAERILEGPRAPRPEFAPVKQFGFDGDDPAPVSYTHLTLPTSDLV